MCLIYCLSLHVTLLQKEKRESESAVSISEHDRLEMLAFKNAVQGPNAKKELLTDQEQRSLLHQDPAYIAAKLGLSKSLIRTNDETLSGTKQFAKSLNYFGRGDDDDENPAKRQRIKREQAAQRAMATARAFLASKNSSDASDVATGSSSSSLMNRFSSSGKQI